MVFRIIYWLLDFIWLASYPRSGNYFVRTILFHCFNIKTGSLYYDDCYGNKELSNYVGHLEHKNRSTTLEIDFPKDQIKILKTHSLHNDNRKTIYIIRDGRASLVSLYEYYGKKFSLKTIMEGKTIYGKWCDHIDFWDPLYRRDTLLLSYEELYVPKT